MGSGSTQRSITPLLHHSAGPEGWDDETLAVIRAQLCRDALRLGFAWGYREDGGAAAGHAGAEGAQVEEAAADDGDRGVAGGDAGLQVVAEIGGDSGGVAGAEGGQERVDGGALA